MKETGRFARETQTLIEMLEYHVERRPDAVHMHLIDDDGAVSEITLQEFWQGARRVADGLVRDGLEQGQAVSIMLPTCRDFFDAFFGILMAGGVPVPMYPPVRPSQIEEHMRRQAVILDTARVPVMITVPQAVPLGRFLQARVASLRRLTTVPELQAEGRPGPLPRLDPGHTAFLQFTSGSTGNPKGVVLSHANLLANVRAIVDMSDVQPDDKIVSWLPLYHDLGLIGANLSTLYAGIPVVLMSPLRFLRKPARWLQAISDFRGTLSAAPNFAYELCVQKVPDEVRKELDLSCWRFTFNGAEPVSIGTLQRFAERFAEQGYRPECMQPVFGLAENAVALTGPVLGRAPRIDRIDRATFADSGEAVPVDADAAPEAVQEVVGCGPVIPDHELRVVDDAGHELPDRREGRIQFRGPSATAGYFENPEATAALVLEDGWLDSGDLGYVVAGEIYPTARRKDLIIRGGRNIYPHELEEAVGDLPGVRKGCVAVFAARDDAGGTEKVVVLAETRERGAAREALAAEVLRLSAEVLGSPADDVVLAPPQTVLKTSSGKLRRAACRQRYERGLLTSNRAVWLQWARMGAETLAHQLRRAWRGAWAYAYAAWFWLVFGLGYALGYVAVVTLPLSRRNLWRVGQAVCRGILALAGVRLERRGLEHLEAVAGPAVYVANHTSYLDHLVLVATLPPGTVFVGKRELQDNPLVRPMLDRLGCLYVDRFARARGGDAPARIRARLEEGTSVAVYPEGTCIRQAGLLRFQLGAFLAAAEAGAPVVPVALTGVRSLLRPETLFPRRYAVAAEVGAPLGPEGMGWEAAVKLKDAARGWILEAAGEPDLEHEDPLRFF